MSVNECAASNMHRTGSQNQNSGKQKSPCTCQNKFNISSRCTMCRFSKTPKLIDDLKHVYEERMMVLEANADGDSDKERISMLKKWVNDLSEQNLQLVNTVGELEQEASHRVELLEDKLRETSLATNDVMTCSQEFNNRIKGAAAEKAILETHLGQLQSDIRNLCQLIRQARQSGNWSTDGFTFYEVTKEDIFGSIHYPTGQQDTLMLLMHKDEQIRDLVKKVQMLEDQALGKPCVSSLDDTTAGKMVQHLEEDLRRAEMKRTTQHTELLELSCQLKDLEFRFEFAQREKKQISVELSSVHRELSYKTRQVDALNQAIADMEKSSKDMQAALTAEVANKHDMISQLRRECQQLEERCHRADMQINFKDGIIKELRKEVKFSRSKIAELGGGISEKNLEANQSAVINSQPVEFEEANEIIADTSGPQATAEKPAKSRPKVSKFFQPNTGGYITASGHPFGDSNKSKPSCSCIPKSDERVSRERRSCSPPSKDQNVRGDGKGKCLVCGDDQAALKANLKCKDELIEKLKATIKDHEQKLAEVKKVRKITKDCSCNTEPTVHENPPVNCTKSEVDQLIGNLCNCNGDDQHIGLKRIIGNLQTSLQLAHKELKEAQEMYLNDKSCVRLTAGLSEYGTRFQKEEVASDEMKEAMNNLIKQLQEREDHIRDQEQTIDQLRDEVRGAKQGKATKKQMGKTISVTFKDTETALFPTPTKLNKKAELDLKLSHCKEDEDCRSASHANSLIGVMEDKLEKRKEYITLQAEIIEILQTMLRQAEDLQEDNCIHLSGKMKQTHLEQQDRIEELMRRLVDNDDGGKRHRKCVKKERRPPKILRAASVEEFRVKTVEAQAAVEDVMEEIDALLNNLYCRENKLNDLDKILWSLHQALSEYVSIIRKLHEGGKGCDLRKQTTDLAFLKKSDRIEQLNKEFDESLRNMTKLFDRLMKGKEEGSCAEYQASANECQRVMSNIASEVSSAIHSITLYREQHQATLNKVQLSVQELESNVATVQDDVRSYMKYKTDSEKSREESQRKIEKWQAELDNAQDELRRNVENYRHTDYTVPVAESSCKCSVQSPRSSYPNDSILQDYVYRGKDANVRATIEYMKEEIESLTEKLEQQEKLNIINERKLCSLLKSGCKHDCGQNITNCQKEKALTDEVACLHKLLDEIRKENAQLKCSLRDATDRGQLTQSCDDYFDTKYDQSKSSSYMLRTHGGPKTLVLLEPNSSKVNVQSNNPDELTINLDRDYKKHVVRAKKQLKDIERQKLTLFDPAPGTSNAKGQSYDVEAMENYIELCQREIAELKQALKECQCREKSMNCNVDKMCTLQRALEISREEVTQLRQALRDMERKHGRTHHCDEEVANHCENISVLQRTSDKTEQELQERYKEIKLLCKEKGAHEMEIQSLTASLRCAEEEVQRSKLALPNLQELRRSIVSEYCDRCGRLEAELERARVGPCSCCRTITRDNSNKDSERLELEKLKRENDELKLQICNQQITIGNLQEALLSTKRQLEELQGKTLDVSAGPSGSWTEPNVGYIPKNVVHDV